MSGGRDHGEPIGQATLASPAPAAEGSPLHRGLSHRQAGDRRRALTRPTRPGFCWLAVQLHGHDVERPALVIRWDSTPHGWRALVAWTGLEEDLHLQWVPADLLTQVTPQPPP